MDILGRVVMQREEGTKPQGDQLITLDLSSFSQGIYYYVLKADNKVAGVRKMMVK
jgi:hypothetical protein